MLVDVQVELVDAREPAEALRDALQLEQALGHQAISTRRVPTSPCGRTFIEHDQDHADQDQPRDARLRGEARVPDERAEVERRDQQQVADDRPHRRQQRARARSSATNAQLPTTRAFGRQRHPVRERVAEPAADVAVALGRARPERRERARARRSRTRPCRRARPRATATAAASRSASRATRMVDDPRRVVRRPQRLERDVDDERAEDDAAEAAGAAEDQHRVDGDQQRHVEVGGEDGRVQRGEERAGEPGDAGAARERDRASAGSRACPSSRPRASPRAATARRGPCATRSRGRRPTSIDEEEAERGVEVARDRARASRPKKWNGSMSAIPFGPPVRS